jgi:hypothetical protein
MLTQAISDAGTRRQRPPVIGARGVNTWYGEAFLRTDWPIRYMLAARPCRERAVKRSAVKIAECKNMSQISQIRDLTAKSFRADHTCVMSTGLAASLVTVKPASNLAFIDRGGLLHGPTIIYGESR